jgi:hypothetical protein
LMEMAGIRAANMDGDGRFTRQQLKII